jgi:translation elongation factor EF-Ts
LRSFTAEDAEDAKERLRRNAKDAEDAKEQLRRVAKDAKAAKEKPQFYREGARVDL